MDPRPARPLVRPEDADPFAFSDQEPKMSVLRRKRNPELRKTQTRLAVRRFKVNATTPGKPARLLFYYNDVHAPREHGRRLAGDGAVRTTIDDDASGHSPRRAGSLVRTLDTFARCPRFVDSFIHESR